MLFTASFTSYQSVNSADRRISVDLHVEDNLSQIEIGDGVMVCSKFNFKAITGASKLAEVSCQLVDKGSADSDSQSCSEDTFLRGSATYVAGRDDDGLPPSLFFSLPLETKEFDRTFQQLVKDDLKVLIDIEISGLSFGWRPDGSDLKWTLAADTREWDRKPVSSVTISFFRREISEITFISSATARHLALARRKSSETNMKLALLDLIFEALKHHRYYFVVIIIFLALVLVRG